MSAIDIADQQRAATEAVRRAQAALDEHSATVMFYGNESKEAAESLARLKAARAEAVRQAEAVDSALFAEYKQLDPSHIRLTLHEREHVDKANLAEVFGVSVEALGYAVEEGLVPGPVTVDGLWRGRALHDWLLSRFSERGSDGQVVVRLPGGRIYAVFEAVSESTR